MKRKVLQRALRNGFAWVLSIVMFVPLLLILVNSFKDRVGANAMSMSLPKTLHWSNYTTVIEEGKLVQSFVNSLFYTTASTVLGIALASIAAYIFARNATKLNRFLYFFIIMGIAMPINFVTLTKVMQATQLINTQLGIIVLLAVMSIPFSVFLIYGFVGSVPRELDEAGIMDGCAPFRLFCSIILPLLTPVVVTVGILNFMGAWNDFILPLYYLNDTAKWPMTLAVYNFFGRFQVNWNLVSADIVLTTLPVIVIYLLGQRYIISGMTSGSVKG
ncbi:carbohydrate ABC transporter permease [Paenibacillus arenilitoris]|uniref:Carbohydrate ABC transporter permease n=1 Tax=Paenibacillus arenilitoris TaxID=2772299 RepID=A0A927CTK0_9BACL|nr:carbohydrate ABC transporter permease [Paenibacillus arenilitoris]MBD2871986.1 carbohydrate ABC transporter permease [Paenibacillus arenilitoris]